MLIVNKMNGNIYYEGVDIADCKNNMPPNKENYIILPFEQYDDFIDHLVSIQESKDNNSY